jgi:hypothetical protein
MSFWARVRGRDVLPTAILVAAHPPRWRGLHAKPCGQPRQRRAPALHEPSDVPCAIAGDQAPRSVDTCPVDRRAQRRERLSRLADRLWVLWVAAPRVSPIVSGRRTSPSRTRDRDRRRVLPHNPNRGAQPPAASLNPPERVPSPDTVHHATPLVDPASRWNGRGDGAGCLSPH